MPTGAKIINTLIKDREPQNPTPSLGTYLQSSYMGVELPPPPSHPTWTPICNKMLYLKLTGTMTLGIFFCPFPTNAVSALKDDPKIEDKVFVQVERPFSIRSPVLLTDEK